MTLYRELELLDALFSGLARNSAALLNSFRVRWLAVAVSVLLLGSAERVVGDEPNNRNVVAAEESSQEFELPKRQEKAIPSTQTSFMDALEKTAGKLGIGVGVLLVILILFSKKSDRQTLPKEAIEILGRVPFSAKQSVQ
ncbi:MAG: hypothetical protein VX438_17305, partial [Planctomycetota bacterium]|nr:hypothetical protein [Planctomycetota bacterium]